MVAPGLACGWLPPCLRAARLEVLDSENRADDACPLSLDSGQAGKGKMKGQDILLLLKLVALDHQIQQRETSEPKGAAGMSNEWRGWSTEPDEESVDADPSEAYTVRGLQAAIGVSKSEISSSLRRITAVNLARVDRLSGRLRPNTKALFEFLAFGLKYVFPAKPGALGRGIPTAFAAPVLAGQIMSAGGEPLVWADALGTVVGQTIPPLFRTVTVAVKKDAELYALLALVDSVRTGQEREAAFARGLLEKQLGRSTEHS